MRLLLVVAMLALTAPTVAAEQVIVFVDGTRMAIQSYEVKGGVVQFTTVEGKLRSVPRSYVNLVATEQANGRAPTTEDAPAPAPAPAAPPQPPPVVTPPQPPPEPEPERMPTEMVTPERPIAPEPEPPPAPVADLASPPPVWANEELQVSLVVPSAAWRLEDMPPSFDVAVALENEATEARATLALIRRQVRGRRDFDRVVSEIEASISSAPRFQPLSAGPVDMDPYQAFEFRFTKDVGFIGVYNRLVIFYSRDLVYVLSLTCPEARVAENESDFDALVRGLVIRKSRDELTF